MKRTKHFIATFATTVITVPLALLFPTNSYADDTATQDALTVEHSKDNASKKTPKTSPMLSITIPVLSETFPKQISVADDVKVDFTRVAVKAIPKPVVKPKPVAPAEEKPVKKAVAKAEPKPVIEPEEQVEVPATTLVETADVAEVDRDDNGFGSDNEYERFMPTGIEPMKDIDDKLVTIAATGKGKPYVWGGTTPEGWDCSGFVQWVYKQAGIDIPRVNQWTAGTVTTKPVPGDIVVQNGGSHVGIYAGGGMMYSALNPQDGTKFHPVNMFPSYFVHIER